jgi:hypothetical protein
MHLLRRWWTNKYKLPWTHEAFQSSTEFDLIVEFYEDLFEKDPNELLKAGKGEDGEIMFEETGDPLIDKWEQELAQGLMPDLTEGMSDASRKKLSNISKKQTKTNIEEINEDYSSQSIKQPNPMFDSKFVRVGSMEESRLLNTNKLERVGRLPEGSLLGVEKKVR